LNSEQLQVVLTAFVLAYFGGSRPNSLILMHCKNLLSRIVSLAVVGAAFIFQPNSEGQAPPFMVIDDARAFEGAAGSTTVLRFPIRFVGAQTLPVAGNLLIVPFSATPATLGATCGAGVDVAGPSLIPFSFPANAPAGSTFVDVLICGDNAMEADERIAALPSNVSNILGVGDPDTGIGVIVNDDGPPAISIGDVNVSTLKGVSKTVRFPVTLHHPSPTPITVNFATRNFQNSFLMFGARSGTLTIPAGIISTNIPVTITGDLEGTFFMDLTNPSANATIGDGAGRATINFLEINLNLAVGTWEITPANADVSVGETVNYAVTWTLPAGKVWRDIDTLNVLFRKGANLALAITWDETSDEFRVCEPVAKKIRKGQQMVCSDGARAGSPVVLVGPGAELDLSQTTVVGSGPTGQDVTLNLGVRFTEPSTGNYTIEVGGSDDTGGVEPLGQAASVKVRK
jgi:hypothetical protein